MLVEGVQEEVVQGVAGGECEDLDRSWISGCGSNLRMQSDGRPGCLHHSSDSVASWGLTARAAQRQQEAKFSPEGKTPYIESIVAMIDRPLPRRCSSVSPTCIYVRATLPASLSQQKNNNYFPKTHDTESNKKTFALPARSIHRFKYPTRPLLRKTSSCKANPPRTPAERPSSARRSFSLWSTSPSAPHSGTY